MKQTSFKFTSTTFKCDSVPISRCHTLHHARQFSHNND